MIFVLDTRTRQARFCLTRGQRIVAERRQVLPRPGASLLAVERFLRKSRVRLKRLTQITVVIGPGMFSFLRAGVVIANTLAATHHVPLRGIKAKNETEAVPLSKLTKKAGSQKPLRPWYGKGPSITIAGRG